MRESVKEFNIVMGVLLGASIAYVLFVVGTQLRGGQLFVGIFQIEIAHMYLPENGPINLGPVPTVIPNLPVIILIIMVIGNIVLFLRNRN